MRVIRYWPTMLILFLVAVAALPPLPLYGDNSAQSAKYHLATPLGDVMPTLNLDDTVTTNATSEFTVGQISVIVILVEFDNLAHTVSREEIHDTYVAKLNDYYREASYGQVWIAGTTIGWYNLNHTLSYYGRDGRMVDDPNNDGGIDSWWLIRDAIAAADPDVDFRDYDQIIVAHAGYGQESSGSSNDIWSVAYWGTWFRTEDTKSFRGGAIVPEMEDQGASPFGVFAHEFGHLLGLVDHYGQGGAKNWIGRWGVMDKGLWNGDPFGSSPAQPTSWDRIKLGWIPPSKIAQPNASMKMEITLSALEVEASLGSYQVIKIPISASRYYLVEARMQIGYDGGLPDEGVIVYSVDTTLSSSNGMLQVVDAKTETETLNDAAYKPGESFTDPTNHITVLVSENSTQSYSVVVDRSGPSPDIAVEKVYFEPPTVSVNETISLKADVANRGTQDASGYKVNCYINDELYHTFTITLKVDSSTTLEVAWRAQSGLSKIRFSLDHSGGQADSNPANDALEADLVVGYSIIIEVPANMTVKVNEDEHTPDRTGKITIGALEGDLIIELSATAPISEGTRLAFMEWSDGDQENPRTIHVTQDLHLIALYQRQYLLNLDPGPGEVSGSGWYAEEEEATIQAVTPCEIVDGKSRLRFVQWTGDQNSTSSTLTLVMDEPKSLSADWQNQYYLAINSPFGPVSGLGWYDEQETVSFSLEANKAEDTGMRATFVGWRGDFSGSTVGAAITMDGPKSVDALWDIEYYLQLHSDYGHPIGSGWYPDGTDVTIKIEPMVEEASGTRHIFTGWTGDHTSNSPDSVVTVNKPITATANWETQHPVQFTTVGIPQGTVMNFTLNGEEKILTSPFTETLWFDQGTIVVFNATQRIPAKLGFYLFDHWEDGKGNRVSGTFTVDKPITLSAVYKQSFGCIIATATFGSELSPEVSFLRNFRESRILASFAGYSFMSVFNRWYYSFSPPIADQITFHDQLKPFLQTFLTPLLAILHVSANVHTPLSSSPELAAVCTGFVASTLIGIVYFSPLVAVWMAVYRKRTGKSAQLSRRTLSSMIGLVGGALGLIVAAEIFHSYSLMQIATGSFVLATITFSASLTSLFFQKASAVSFNLRTRLPRR